MDWFIYIMAAVYFLFYVVLPIALAVMLPVVIYAIVIFVRDMWVWIRWNWRERRR